MNKIRRNELYKLIEQLQDIQSAIEQLRDEEQEYYDNMSAGIQESERGEIAGDNINNMDYALDSLNEAIENLEAATE